LGNLNGETDIGDGLAMSDKLISRFELADDLLDSVANSFHGELANPALKNVNYHSRRTIAAEISKRAGE